MRGGRRHGRHGYRAHIRGNPFGQGKTVSPGRTLGPKASVRHVLAPPEHGPGREHPPSHTAYRHASKLHGRRGHNYDTSEG